MLPFLLGKPKVLLVQACRGLEDQLGVEVYSDDRDTEEQDASQPAAVIPIDADVLIAYSTTPGKKFYY